MDVQTMSERLRTGTLDRRGFVKLTAMMGAGAMLGGWSRSAKGAAGGPTTVTGTGPGTGPGGTSSFEALRRPMARFPQKTDLILLTDRPVQLETPLSWFKEDLTPNEAFFVRWHLAGIPTRVDAGAFRLIVGGQVDRPQSFSLEELAKGFEPVSVLAVAQCSGNSRGFFEPRVMGGQWGNGA